MNFLRVLLIALAVALPVQAQVDWQWTFDEYQLDIKEGGRMNSVAVNPVPGQSNDMYVASETGGLFHSIDAGRHWTHVDELSAIFTQSVAYLPSGAVLVSAKSDFTIDGGGVWRKEVGQDDWVQTLMDPAARLSAYEISPQPGMPLVVFVGTSRGLYKSIDGGLSWVRDFVPPLPDDPAIFSVLATDDLIFIAGPSRIWKLFGAVIDPFNNMGGAREMHAFGWWRERDRVFFVNSTGTLWEFPSLIGGGWELFLSNPHAGNCDGTPFIKAVQVVNENQEFLELYLSDRCGLYKLHTPVAQFMPVNEAWHIVDVDEDAPRDLAFGRPLVNANEEPLLLGTTAGVHLPSGLSWRIAGGGREGGYNALQINEVRGQLVDGNTRPDLYIGTQDNKLWAWRLQDGTLVSHGAEGHFIELPARATPQSDCKAVFVADAQTTKSEELFNGLADWVDPTDADGAPAMIRQEKYIQQVREGVFHDGLALTKDCAGGWEPFAQFTEEPRDLPRLARAGSRKGSADIVYQAYKAPGGRNLLMRITRPLTATTGVIPAYPTMANFGSVGINPTMFAWYQVYAVDPFDPNHLIAADVSDAARRDSGTMRESTNGGTDWRAMPNLTDKVLGTRFNFRAALNGPAAGEIFPIVTAVSFSPQDSRLVLAGTSQAGIFVSTDRGQTWMKITDSERVTYVTSFYWETANTVFVSTYGRGLWKLRNRQIAVSFNDFCASCRVVPDSSAPVHGSALVFEGQVLGVRTSNRQLREVFVTPGSSVVFTGDLDDPQDDITITPSDGRDMKEFEPLPKGPDGWVATGVLFGKDDEVTGAAFAETEMSFLEPTPDEEVKDSTESPANGQPYIRLHASANRGIATAAPQEAVELSATGFTAGKSYEVLVDDVAIKGTVTADRDGAFTITITAPSQTGYHSVAVRMAGEETVIDSSMFLVRY